MHTKLRVVGLGDSTTAGTPGFRSPVEVPPAGKGNPESQYSYWMMKAHPSWDVLNRGVNGERSDEILSRFEKDVLQERPSLVIILAGVNDVFQRCSTDSVKSNLKAMYALAISNHIISVAATILPYNIASPSESRAIAEINDWVEGEARSNGSLFCDTNLVVRNRDNPNILASTPDGLHPDVAGYRRMGEALGATLARAGH